MNLMWPESQQEMEPIGKKKKEINFLLIDVTLGNYRAGSEISDIYEQLEQI